jgi:sec-independent protein translocase protein TatA
VIVIIIFGVGKLPTVGGALGKSIREFRDQAHPEDEDGEDADKSADTMASTSEDEEEDGDGSSASTAASEKSV